MVLVFFAFLSLIGSHADERVSFLFPDFLVLLSAFVAKALGMNVLVECYLVVG